MTQRLSAEAFDLDGPVLLVRDATGRMVVRLAIGEARQLGVELQRIADAADARLRLRLVPEASLEADVREMLQELDRRKAGGT